MLYRGISKHDDARDGGRLLPKGTESAVIPRFDGKWRLDGTFVLGPCEENTARAQQIESGLYGGCGISTSRSEAQAIKFATSGNMEEGFVYVIDESRLAASGVRAIEFPDALHPHECEVTLIAPAAGALPDDVIVEKYAVDDSGSRIASPCKSGM